jgi:hypothetical protein
MLLLKNEIIEEVQSEDEEQEELENSNNTNEYYVDDESLVNSSLCENQLEIQGKIIAAEDQMINIEILRGYIERLGLLKSTTFCIDGQKAIDLAKSLLDDALSDY